MKATFTLKLETPPSAGDRKIIEADFVTALRIVSDCIESNKDSLRNSKGSIGGTIYDAEECVSLGSWKIQYGE